MLNQIILYPILGLPLVIYLGILTVIMVLITALIGTFIFKGHSNIPIKRHVLLARISISLIIIYVLVEILIYLIK